MQIRAARPDDLEPLVAASLAMAHETEGLDLDEATVRRGVAAAMDDAGKGRYFIAVDDGVVGSLFVTREWSDWRHGWYWWIQGVYVAPSHRRQGIYQRLHAAVVDAAREAGDVREVRLYVASDNRPAQATYEALGMHRSDYLVYELPLM